MPNIQSYSSADSCYLCDAQILACEILLIFFECYKYNYTLMQQIISDYIWRSMKLMFLFLVEPIKQHVINTSIYLNIEIFLNIV